MTTTYTINRNEAFNSIEVLFDGKPSEAIREALKNLRFRWHGVKKVWYGYKTEEEVREAIEGAESGEKSTSKTASKTEAEKVNKFGVKVGDIFHASWGYEQTNNTFVQVIALCGEQSVRVREVYPEITKEDAIGPMSADYTYEINNKLLPVRSSSVFIKDQQKGDIKRLCEWGKDSVAIKLDSFAYAHKLTEGSHKFYDSWYA